MLGFFIGIVAGAFQFWLLSIFTKAISSGLLNTKNVLFGLLQFFLPMGVLVGIAFLRRQDLLWTGIGIISALLVCAFIKFITSSQKQKGGGNRNG